jgi:hypothetical protein
MENINMEQIRSKINLERFLFFWKEPALHTSAFMGKTSLKLGVLICSIIDLLLATGIALHCIENYSFIFFVGFFFPSLCVMAGSALMMISMELTDEKRAYYGYITMAISVWLHAFFIALSLIFTFLWSPKYFFRNLIGTVLMVIVVMGIYGYSCWIDYCYTKHLSNGNRDLVESGRPEGLISKEQGPGIMSGPGVMTGPTDASTIRQDIIVPDVERRQI